MMSKIIDSCFDDAFFEIDLLIKIKETIIIAIEGNRGSGKSRLADLLATEYDCNVFHMDDFFLVPNQRTKQRLLEIGGNVDYERFEEQIFDNLLREFDFRYEIYDYRDDTFKDSDIISRKQLNIVEGVYSLHPNFKDLYDLKIFLFADKKTRAKRIYERNGENFLRKYANDWLPLEDLYFESTDIRDECDLAIDTSGIT